MRKNSYLKTLAICSALLTSSYAFSQEVIYQQNFDGNNGNFTNTIVSATTPINGWLASSTATQYGNYRHLWNWSDDASGGNDIVMPISGKSLGMGFFNANSPNVAHQAFRTWDGEEPSAGAFYTTRWAHVGVSTAGYENITVEFKWRCVGEVEDDIVYDYGTINTSINGGSTWLMDDSGGQGGQTSEHGTFASGLYYGNAEVKTTTLTLPANRADQPNFRLAFRMVVDEGYGSGGGFIIDDIIIRGTKIPTAGTIEVNKNKLNAYKDGENFVVTTKTSNIKEINLYDMSGKLVTNLSDNNNKEVRIHANPLAKGIYILKAKLENGEELSQKIKN